MKRHESEIIWYRWDKKRWKFQTTIDQINIKRKKIINFQFWGEDENETHHTQDKWG